MQTYNELLSEFHHGEESVVEEDCHVHYAQLLNQLKLNKDKKLSARKKVKFQSSRLKTHHNDSPKNSLLERSLQISRVTQVFDPYKQKRSLIELQGQSLQKEINYIESGFEKLRVEKHLLEEQLEIINKKQLQISFALCESQNNLEELRSLIKQQKLSNEKDFIHYDHKISELTHKLAVINEENMLSAKHFEHLNTAKVQTKNKSLLGTILMWQSEESKLKKLPKKLYTKTQIQSMLRALFLISKLSELNYGNIIEHLVKMAESNNLTKIKPKSSPKIFLNQKGEQVTIYELIDRLQQQLLTPNQCKFLSKTKIVDFYATKDIIIQSDWQPTNLLPETLQLIKKVVTHFQNLTSWFSRIQKRNLQLSENYRSLIKVDEELDNQIKSIQSSAVENSINYLQSREQQIEHLHEKLNSVCKVIFLFNINMHDLIRRFQNLNKFFDKIVKSTQRRTHRKTFVQFSEDTQFLKRINKSLFKSPECIIMDWNNVIKRIKTDNNFVMSAEMFEQIPQNDMYFETVMKNDLLRIYAQPSMFDREKPYIDNLKKTFDYVINEEYQIIEKLCSILKDLLMFSKNGLIECQSFKVQKKQEKKKVTIKEQSASSKNLDPLIKLLQQSNVKLDKFFVKDQIKEETQKPQDTDIFCVQSNEFYRRDNFKLIEKLEKLDLKRKGLLPSVPFAVNTSLELQPFTRTVEDISMEKDTSRFGSTRNSYRKRQPRLSHQMLSTRHNVVSERRQFENSRKKDLKNLLSNISNIAAENLKYRIRKKVNCQEQMLSTSISRVWVNKSHLETLTKRDKNK